MAVIYTQAEADFLIAMPKWIDRDAWESRDPPKGRWNSQTIRVLPDGDDGDRLSFWLKIGSNEKTGEYHVQLWVNLKPKGPQPLVRYDYQMGSHANPPGRVPKVVKPRIIHAHRYSADDLEKLRHWDALAVPLALSSVGSDQQIRDRILRKFIEDTKIEIRSAETHSELFGRRQ